MRNFVITVNGQSYEVGVEEVGGSVSAPVAVPVVKEQVAAAAPVEVKKAAAPEFSKVAAPAPANGEKLLSPFPGLIKNLLVANGDMVKKDQPVLVLEAMKMDNDITAPCDGVITFQVQKGANVESDSVLAVIG